VEGAFNGENTVHIQSDAAGVNTSKKIPLGVAYTVDRHHAWLKSLPYDDEKGMYRVYTAPDGEVFMFGKEEFGEAKNERLLAHTKPMWDGIWADLRARRHLIENAPDVAPQDDAEAAKPAFNEATTREFLTILCGHFARATEGLDRPGWMQLSVLFPDGRSKLLPTRFPIGDVERLVQHAKAYAESGHNVYVEGRTVRDLEGTKRGTLKDTRWVVGMSVDSDGDKDMAGVLPPEANPTLIVESSGDTGNRHLWFMFDRAIPADEAKKIGDAMRAAVGADHATGNPVQPYRVAGTPNFPSPEKRRNRSRVDSNTRILEHTNKLWTPDELLTLFKPQPEKVKAKKSSIDAGPMPTSVPVWDGDASKLPPDVLGLVKTDVDEGNRSSRFHSVMWKLVRLRLSVKQCIDLFNAFPDGIGNRYITENRLPREVQRSYDAIIKEEPQILLPVIVISKGDVARIVAETATALQKKQAPFYSRGGGVVTPIVQEFAAADDGTTMVTNFAEVEPPAMVLEMAHTANYVSMMLDKEIGQWVPVPEDPPGNIARMMLSPNRHHPLPSVTGIVTIPLLRPDGSILNGRGYDPKSRLYYAPDKGLALPRIPEQPTEDDALVALKLLTDLLSEFRFESELDRAVALSGMFTGVVRPSLLTAPMHLIRAHVAGTGKSYLVDLFSVIVTGQRCPVIVAPKSEEELEKRLGSLIMAGVPMISLDNVDYDLGGPTLCQITERPRVSLRILGLSKAPEFDCRAAVYTTGNNIGVRADMTRRAVFCSMDAMEERPETRKFGADPLQLVLADRGKYIGAIMTIIRAHLRSGRVSELSPVGSYGGWCRMVRDPLVWLGEEDPWKSTETARAEDPELLDIREFFESGVMAFDTNYKTSQIIDMATDNETKALLMRVSESTGQDVDPLRLGKWLRKISGRPVGGMRIMPAGTDKTRPRWRLMKMPALRSA
jgi:putative DNA primase/helicase